MKTTPTAEDLIAEHRARLAEEWRAAHARVDEQFADRVRWFHFMVKPFLLRRFGGRPRDAVLH